MVSTAASGSSSSACYGPLCFFHSSISILVILAVSSSVNTGGSKLTSDQERQLMASMASYFRYTIFSIVIGTDWPSRFLRRLYIGEFFVISDDVIFSMNISTFKCIICLAKRLRPMMISLGPFLNISL